MSTIDYTVRVTREGDAWLADVTNLAGAHTYSRSYAALRREVDEVIRLVEDFDDSEVFSVAYEFDDFNKDVAKLPEIGVKRVDPEDETEARAIAASGARRRRPS